MNDERIPDVCGVVETDVAIPDGMTVARARAVLACALNAVPGGLAALAVYEKLLNQA